MAEKPFSTPSIDHPLYNPECLYLLQPNTPGTSSSSHTPNAKAFPTLALNRSWF